MFFDEMKMRQNSRILVYLSKSPIQSSNQTDKRRFDEPIWMRISSKIPGQRLLCGSLQLVLVQVGPRCFLNLLSWVSLTATGERQEFGESKQET